MFALSSDERVAMRAIEILDKRKGEAAAPRDTSASDFLAACTPKQRQRAIEIATALKELQNEVFEANPKLRPAWWRSRTEQEPDYGQPIIQRDQPPRPAAEIPVAPAERARIDETPGGDERQITPAQYEEVGLFTTPTGEVSHNLGDEYARAVLDGTIAFEDARATHEAHQRQMKRISS
jgi:hypothetical protein